MSTKDEILANFQACTEIDDYGKAFTFLSEANWNLTEAVNKVMSNQERENSSVTHNHFSAISSFQPVFSASSEQDLAGVSSVSDDQLPPPFVSRPSFASDDSPSMPSTSQSNPSPDVFDINIQIASEGATDGNSFPLELPSTTTIGELKTLLHQLVGIPPCNQVLDGFTQPMVSSNTVITRDLLPKNLSLTLNTARANAFLPIESQNGSVDMDEWTLCIRDQRNGKDYRVPCQGSRQLKEVKSDMFHFTGIPVRHQVWTGWPSHTSETATLSSMGIPKAHQLTVNQQTVIERTPRQARRAARVADAASSESSSGDEFEDASDLLLPEDDFLMCDVPSSAPSQSLIPANVDDDLSGVLSFIEEFQKRYGACTPMFYEGTLDAALKESLMLSARNRKPLALYLHHDKSVSVNVFCSHSLCPASVVDYMATNFVAWGWDLTHEPNKVNLLAQVTTHLGVVAASTIRSYNLEKLPALLILNRSRGSIEILSAIHGNANVDEVMSSLVHAFDLFEEQRKSELYDEDQREMRETMRAEQDAAYHASLEADRAKAQAKRKAELEDRVERERQQSLQEQEEAIRESVRCSLESDLPPEPGPDCTHPTATLKFRVPDAQPFCRTFTKTTTLQIVLNFLCVKGFPSDKYKYLQSWPRRCLTSLNVEKNLRELNIPNQETITVEERSDFDD